MLVAVQDESGEVVMNPGSSQHIHDHTVVFAIAKSEVRRVQGLGFRVCTSTITRSSSPSPTARCAATATALARAPDGFRV